MSSAHAQTLDQQATAARKPKLEIADIVRRHGADFLSRHPTSPMQRRVLRAIVSCRTAILGGHIHRCVHCSHTKLAYNSCRNRHCPKCQGSVAARWMLDREAELLDVSYFHLVFTLPQAVAALALQNRKLVYNILFAASSKTLLQVAANSEHLGARIGFISVLHTWGQNLHHHPHVHCVVPAGGISPDGSKWIGTKRDNFFLPVRVLSRVFRGKFIDLLKKAWNRGELELHGKLAHLRDPGQFHRWLNKAVSNDWVVYAKPPFGGPQVVLKYLARYTHRVAISNHRLYRLADGKVTFGVKDYANQGRRSTMTLTAEEFLRRFLQHVLPKGMMRIRHYGFMANRDRQNKLLLCRKLLGMIPEPESNQTHLAEGKHAQGPPKAPWDAVTETPGKLTISGDHGKAPLCPQCNLGRLMMTPILRADFPGPDLHKPSRSFLSRRNKVRINHSS